MRKLLWIALALVLYPTILRAEGEKKIAVIDFVNTAGLQRQEVDYITHVVRASAAKLLTSGYLVMTREVDPGVYEVAVRDPRYYEAGERTSVAAGERKTVDVPLKPKEGALQVEATDDQGNAVAGDLYLDDAKLGRAPWAGKAMVGRHQVKLVADRGGQAAQEVEVAHKQVTTVTLKVGHTRGSYQGVKSKHLTLVLRLTPAGA